MAFPLPCPLRGRVPTIAQVLPHFGAHGRPSPIPSSACIGHRWEAFYRCFYVFIRKIPMGYGMTHAAAHGDFFFDFLLSRIRGVFSDGVSCFSCYFFHIRDRTFCRSSNVVDRHVQFEQIHDHCSTFFLHTDFDPFLHAFGFIFLEFHQKCHIFSPHFFMFFDSDHFFVDFFRQCTLCAFPST